jgi:uncharacterized membrane protein YdfJ with MMPL/SSD domain
MVGMVATGFLGMNLFNHTEMGTAGKIAVFIAVFVPTIVLTGFTVLISRRLATFMEALASERMTWNEKSDAFRQIWGGARKARAQRVAGADDLSRRPAPVPRTEALHSSD